VNPHGNLPTSGCPLFSEFVHNFAAIDRVPLPPQHTVLFLAVDARAVPTEAIASAAERLLASGLVYICVWGPDCERVHDIFDEVYAGDGSTEPSFTLMSTWHSHESLEEALWFFIEHAVPVDTEITTTSYLCITVRHRGWATAVRDVLSNLGDFRTRMVDDESHPNGRT